MGADVVLHREENSVCATPSPTEPVEKSTSSVSLVREG